MFDQFVPHVPQGFHGIAGESPWFVKNMVGAVLVVKPGTGDGAGEAHSVIHHVGDRLKNRGNDGWSTW